MSYDSNSSKLISTLTRPFTVSAAAYIAGALLDSAGKANIFGFDMNLPAAYALIAFQPV